MLEALPPLRPAFFFCAVVPPCELFPPDPLDFPPCLDASGAFAILAARCFDMPLSLSASYCFSFFTFDDLLGMTDLLFETLLVCPYPLDAAKNHV